MPSDPPSLTEQQLLLAVWRLADSDEGAYGLRVRDELAQRTGRKIAVGAIYTTLVRLEKKGLVASRLSDPVPVRGGKAKRFFSITPAGLGAVAEARRQMDELWEGLEPSPEEAKG